PHRHTATGSTAPPAASCSRSGKTARRQLVELRPYAPCPRRRIGSPNASASGGRLTQLHSACYVIILGRRFEHHPSRWFNRGCSEFSILVRCLRDGSSIGK